MARPVTPSAPTNASEPAVPPGDVRARWDANARWWDETVGDGNATQRMILGPATERLLGSVRGGNILDVACGNGHFARRLADLGAHVLAVDFSEAFLERARARSTSYVGRIEYQSIDVTSPTGLAALGSSAFDAAVCTMALMDIAEIRPLFHALARCLRRGAPVVFSVTHPTFNRTGVVRGLEETDGPKGIEERYFVRVEQYRTGGPGLGTGIVGQPAGHWYFERTLTGLLAPALDAGFAVDAFEELYCPSEMPSPRPLSWGRFTEIPPFLIVRVRLRTSPSSR
ncbi:MAG: class I SAM-dependent methyltransferase [Thermoplasmata archaeon]|nr:class I SAM-dependent methyltransferase [Thermoplasmata archaeon]